MPISKDRVIRNFIDSYGYIKFKWLINALAKGMSGQTIANEFNVSRERVRQWKNTFGVIVTHYKLHPETVAIIREIEAKR